MTLDIRAVLDGAVEKTMTSSGAALVGVMFVIGMLNQVISVNAVVTVLQDHLGIAVTGPTPFYAGITSLPTLAVLFIGVTLLSVWYTIVGTRIFLNGRTDLDVPVGYVTDGIPSRMGNILVGGIVSALAVSIAMVLFIVPGIYVMIGLLFFPVIIVKEDVSFIDAFRQSWELVRGHRWRLLALGIIMTVIGAALGIIGSQVGGLAGPINTEAQFMVQALFAAVGNVFQIALLVETYQYLTADA